MTNSSTFLTNLLSSTNVKSLLATDKHQQLITIDSKATIKDAVKILSLNKIASAPVYEVASDSFLGVLEYSHLVKYVLQVLHKLPKDEDTNISLDITDVVQSAIPNVTVQHLLSSQEQAPWEIVDARVSVIDVLKLLVHKNLKRVFVMSQERDDKELIAGKIFEGVVTESTIVSFIANKCITIKPQDWVQGEKSIGELKVIQKDVDYVLPEDSCLDALEKLYTKQVHSIAIVSAGTKELMGSISMSDIKEILATPRSWRHLFDPSFQFFQFMRSEQGIRQGKDAMPNFSVSPDSSLLSVLKKLAAVKTHQIWVTQEQRELVGVVSISHILSVLV